MLAHMCIVHIAHNSFRHCKYSHLLLDSVLLDLGEDLLFLEELLVGCYWLSVDWVPLVQRQFWIHAAGTPAPTFCA